MNVLQSVSLKQQDNHATKYKIPPFLQKAYFGPPRQIATCHQEMFVLPAQASQFSSPLLNPRSIVYATPFLLMWRNHGESLD